MLFIDLLGVREMARGQDAPEALASLEQALKRPVGDFLADDSPWPAAFFSDTLVMVSPVNEELGPEGPLGELAVNAAWIQINLATSAGIFLRGSLTLGDVYLREGLLFGPALVDAYDLERQTAVHPRVILSEEAVSALRHEMEEHGPGEAPYLREQQDGSVFIDYLDILLDDPEDPAPILGQHRDRVRHNLAAHLDQPARWEKYRWVAEYHDAFCRENMPGSPGLLVDEGGHAREFTRFTVAPRP